MRKQLCDSSVIVNNARKTQKLFVQGYNLEVHDVIKYMHVKTSCHCIKLIISRTSQVFVRRNKQKP